MMKTGDIGSAATYLTVDCRSDIILAKTLVMLDDEKITDALG